MAPGSRNARRFPVSGQEMGRKIALATSRRLKIRIYTEAIAELPASEQFDVITLFDVLEHVPDPAAVLLPSESTLATAASRCSSRRTSTRLVYPSRASVPV
jgi:2-polyprenyl-3-methyl-5-hydroxy-6-metoxy-1,4-benzoquinol methylase